MSWHPIETAPRDGTPIICDGGDGINVPQYVEAYWDDYWGTWNPNCHRYSGGPLNPTMWIPKP